MFSGEYIGINYKIYILYSTYNILENSDEIVYKVDRSIYVLNLYSYCYYSYMLFLNIVYYRYIIGIDYFSFICINVFINKYHIGSCYSKRIP